MSYSKNYICKFIQANSWHHRLLRLPETHKALQLPVFFFLLFFLPALSRILGNSKQKIILQTIEQLIQYMVLEILFRYLKYTVVIRIRKNLRNFPFKQYEVIRRLATLCLCKQSTSNSFQTCFYCIYSLKFYDKLIIILLTNNLTNICSEMSKIWLILWMAYTCNGKGLEEVEKLGRNECTLNPWPRSPVMSGCSRPYQ